MSRRSERLNWNSRHRILWFYRATLVLAALSLFWVAKAWGKENFRQPKSIGITKKAQITKRSEWVDTKVTQDEEFQNSKADLLADKRHRLEVEIEKVLLRTTKVPNEQRKNLLLRLGGYYLEDYYYELGKAYRELDSREKTGKKSTVNTLLAEKALSKSKQIFSSLLQAYPNDKQHDEMLYFYAFTSLNQNKSNEAIATFDKLRLQHPKSKYTPDATAQLGDYYFDRASFKKAEDYYDSLIRINYKPLLPYAIYKKAWCEYKDGRLEASLNHFKWVILNEDHIGAAVPMQIKKEALQDIALPFADLNEANPPLAFFKTQGPDAFRKGIESIANLWQERGRYPLATQYFEELLASDPTYPKNGSYDLKIVEGLVKQNRFSAAVDKIDSSLPKYVSRSEAKENLKQWEESVRGLGLVLHANYQATKSTGDRNLAIRNYESYLQFFSESTEANNLRNNLANLEFKNGEYIKAAAHYLRVYKDSKQELQKQEALGNAFVSYNEQMNQERKSQGLGSFTKDSRSKIAELSLKETPLSDTETKFIKLGDLYVSKYPKADDAPQILHETGYVQYAHRQFEEALKKFRDLVKNYPQHESSISASYLTLDMLNQMKDYDTLITTAKNLLKTGPSRREFRENVAKVLRQSELKRIALLEEKQSYEEAAKGYLAYSKEYGVQDKALHETALFNAAQNFYKAERYAAAVQTQEEFLSHFPNSRHASQTRLEVAKMYEQFGEYTKAAPLYEQFALENPKNVQSDNAMRMAGLLYWGSNNVKKAEQIFITLQSRSPKVAKLAEADLLEIYESSGKMDKQIEMHLKFVNQSKGSPIELIKHKMAIAELKTQQKGRVPASLVLEIEAIGDKHPSLVKKNALAIDAYSKAKQWALLSKEAAFKRLKFRLPQEKLEKTLKRKIEMMKELETEYQKISRLGSPHWGLGSLYKAGRLYAILATDIEQAPLPTELTGQQLDLYRNGIQKTFVEPFRKKALAFAEGCMAQAEKLLIVSAWTERCYSLASGLVPTRFPKARTFYLPPVQMALLLPDGDKSKTALGGMEESEHPFSSPLFFKSVDRSTSSVVQGIGEALLTEEMYDISDGKSVAPSIFSYRTLSKEQQNLAQRSIASEKPKSNEEQPTFSYLNSLRLFSPRAAITAIQDALKRDPKNSALTNLLAMTYLDQDNLAAAKVTWLSLNTREKASAEVLNNLGVLSLQESRDERALKFFTEAHTLSPGSSATLNLAFLMLKNHAGTGAKKYFSQCIEKNPKSAPSQVGRLVAMIQSNESDTLKTELQDLTQQYKTDPYARLSVSYYLIDLANDPEMARQILSEYLKEQSNSENEIPFRRALDETARLAKRNSELPSEDEIKSVEASLQ